MNWFGEKVGKLLARYLEQPSKKYETFAATPPDILHSCLQKGDVLLVEGNLRISVAIKYITQSTWSHAALYVGDALPIPEDGSEPDTLIEADLSNGVIAVPLSKYADFNTRICRPVRLTPADVQNGFRCVALWYELIICQGYRKTLSQTSYMVKKLMRCENYLSTQM